eukprot:246879-Hanusia_phi.AAC.1
MIGTIAIAKPAGTVTTRPVTVTPTDHRILQSRIPVRTELRNFGSSRVKAWAGRGHPVTVCH